MPWGIKDELWDENFYLNMTMNASDGRLLQSDALQAHDTPESRREQRGNGAQV
jgi:hypothetical protein